MTLLLSLITALLVDAESSRSSRSRARELRGRLGLEEEGAIDPTELRGNDLLLWIGKKYDPLIAYVLTDALADIFNFEPYWVQEGSPYFPHLYFYFKRLDDQSEFWIMPWLARELSRLMPKNERAAIVRKYRGAFPVGWELIFDMKGPYDAYFYDAFWNFRSVLDWIRAEASSPAALNNYTLVGAQAASEAWHRRFAGTPLFQTPLGGGEVVATWPEGAEIVILKTPDDFAREGAMMGHCIGGELPDEEWKLPEGKSDYWKKSRDGHGVFFSYRSPDGVSKATVEVGRGFGRPVVPAGSLGMIYQVQGLRDQPVTDPAVASRLVAFLRRAGVKEEFIRSHFVVFGGGFILEELGRFWGVFLEQHVKPLMAAWELAMENGWTVEDDEQPLEVIRLGDEAIEWLNDTVAPVFNKIRPHWEMPFDYSFEEGGGFMDETLIVGENFENPGDPKFFIRIKWTDWSAESIEQWGTVTRIYSDGFADAARELAAFPAVGDIFLRSEDVRAADSAMTFLAGS